MKGGGFSGEPDGIPGWSYASLFLLLWLVVQAVVILFQHPGVVEGAQIDADGYMRLVRVLLLLESGAWFDGTIPRSNWPYGESHHWTRPLDVLILLSAMPFRLLMGWDGAVALSGMLISPLVHLITCVAAVWVIRPLVPGPARFLAMPAILLQMGLLAYGSPGRADHHALIFLLFVVALGFWIRALLDPKRGRLAFLAGMISGLGIWVSPETLLPLALLFASGGLSWIIDGERFSSVNRNLCLGLTGGVLAAILLEHPPSLWLVRAYDQISVVHLTMSGLALVFWWMAGQLRSDSRKREPSMRARLLTAVGGGILTAGTLRLLHPNFFRGPWVDADREVIDLWLRHVKELQPLFPSQGTELGLFLIHLGLAFALIPVLGWWVYREWNADRRNVWILLLLSLLVYVPLASYQVRFSGYAGTVVALVMVELIKRGLDRADQRRAGFSLRMARVGVMTGVLLGPISLSITAGALAQGIGVTWGMEGDGVAGRASVCALSGIEPALTAPDGLGARPRTIVAFIDFGPELLYRTDHRVEVSSEVVDRPPEGGGLKG